MGFPVVLSDVVPTDAIDVVVQWPDGPRRFRFSLSGGGLDEILVEEEHVRLVEGARLVNPDETPQDVFFRLVRAERDRPERKWGSRRQDGVHWLPILMEEVGEAARAILNLREGDVLLELVHVAAVACAWGEQLLGSDVILLEGFGED